jgi:long-chain acyl-CoA synthetase
MKDLSKRETAIVRRYPTILEIVQEAIWAQGDKLAIATPPPAPKGQEYAEISYQALGELSDKVAAALQHLGVRPGDHVAVLTKPRPEWLVAALGVLKAGAVAVPIDPLLKAVEVHRLLGASDVVGTFVSSELLPLVQGLETLEFIVDFDRTGESEDERIRAWEAFWGSATHPYHKREVRPDDLAFLLSTSGTTGDAKIVMLTHENITSNIEGVLERLTVGPSDVVISIAPWNHSLGLIVLLATLRVGATHVYTNDYARLADILKRYRATILVAVPKLYHAMYQRLEAAIQESRLRRWLYRVMPRLLGKMIKGKLAGGRLRFFVSGSAPLSPAVIQGFRRLGIGMIEGYGMTEASPVLTFSTPFNDKPGSVGPPLPNVELKLIDVNEEGIGELLARGPNVMGGYYKNPGRTREVLDEEGWLHTGDLAYIDKDGWVYIKGRRKNVIVLESGKNVYPEEIEWELSRIPYVEEVLVRADFRGGAEVIQALIYPNWEEIGKPLPPEKVRRLIWNEIKKRNQHLASYKRIKSEQDVIIVDKPFEKTSLRDIKRYLYVRQKLPPAPDKGQSS